MSEAKVLENGVVNQGRVEDIVDTIDNSHDQAFLKLYSDGGYDCEYYSSGTWVVFPRAKPAPTLEELKKEALDAFAGTIKAYLKENEQAALLDALRQNMGNNPSRAFCLTATSALAHDAKRFQELKELAAPGSISLSDDVKKAAEPLMALLNSYEWNVSQPLSHSASVAVGN